MANYKRRRCRRNCPRAIRGSVTSWRARFGFKPIRLPDWRDRPARHTGDWNALWSPTGSHRNRGRKISSGEFSMMSSYPAWWDRIFHTKPRRAKERRIARAILIGHIDADNAAWPHQKRPHIYYW